MSQPAIRLVVSDVDGTLITPAKVLTPRAQDAVRRLLAAGIHFTIVSARPPRGMRMLVDALGLHDPFAAFNGALLSGPDLAVLRETCLPPDAARSTIGLMIAAALDVWLYTDCLWYVRDPRLPHVERERRAVQFDPEVVAGFDRLLDRVVKLAGVSDDFDAVARCEQEVLARCGEQVAASRSQPYFLDVTHVSVNKGLAVCAIADMLNVPLAHVATIGDGPNDVAMFKQSGFSIAMGNATPEIQSAAQVVTVSNQNDGFAEAMERYVLPIIT